MEKEYKIEALKESFDGERTDVFTKHLMCREENIAEETRKFVTYQRAERFNVWLKVKVEYLK